MVDFLFDGVEYVREWGGLREVLIGTAAMVLAVLGRKVWNRITTPVELSPRADRLLDCIQSEDTYQKAKFLTPTHCQTEGFDFRNGRVETRDSSRDLLESFPRAERKILRAAVKSLCREVRIREDERAEKMALAKLDNLLTPPSGKVVEGSSPFCRS